jgi:DNA ligase-1
MITTNFIVLAKLAEELAGEAGRLKKRAAIAAAVGRVAGESVEDAGRFCLYLAGQPFAEADPRKLNAGGALLTRAVKVVSGCSDTGLGAAYRRHGDLGAAAAEVWVSEEPTSQDRDATPASKERLPGTPGVGHPQLRLDEVGEAFEVMAGARTTAVRAAAVEGLLRRATGLEAKYLLKLMLGDMRIGVKQSLIEEGIAVAAGAEVAAVRHAVMLEADLSRAVERAFAGTLGEARMRLFHPLGFMLASPVETPEEAVERFTEKPVTGGEAQEAGGVGVEAFLEDKYDGMRAQVHCGDPEQVGRVAVYSRNREDITESFPEIEEAFRGVREPLILDGELLGWDFEAGVALPFSVLGQRIGRKRVDGAMRRSVPVVFMAFDLLFEGGELLLPLALRERRERLEAVVGRVSGVPGGGMEEEKAQGGLFDGLGKPWKPTSQSRDVGHPDLWQEPVQRLMLSPARLVESAEAIDAAYAEARARANEGVMLKAAGSAYLPGRRGLAWVKLKRELATLDVVITGAEFGHGRRAGLLSDYTFAVRGVGGELLNVGKAYSGVTDVEIAELTEWMKAHTLEDRGHFRTVEPLRVIEVAFNNVMRSERHASGFALRFPRILRLREDKPMEEIDTLGRVEEIYQSQPDKGRD